MNEDKDERAQEIKGDAGISVGAAIAGTKFLYDVGQKVLSRVKPDKKLFIQLLDSKYVDKHHVITASFASGHIHGIHIESVYFKDGEPSDIQTFFIGKGDRVGIGNFSNDPGEIAMNCPLLLPPSYAFDMGIRVPEVTEKKVMKKKGTHLICTFSLLNKLGDLETESVPIRLRWA